MMRELDRLGCTLLLTAMGIFISTPASAQITWRRTYGGFGIDEGRSVRQTLDGGYIVFGSTGSFGFGNSDFYLLHLDPNGQRLWSKTYGSSGLDQGWGIASVTDGYALVGYTSGAGDGYDGLLVRTDLNGTQQWQYTYGTPDWDFLFAIDTISNGFLLAGQTYSNSTDADAWLLRTDSNGDTLWTRTFGTPFADEANDVKATLDGGCIVAATFGNSDGTMNAALIKFTADGDEEWRTIIGGSADETGEGVTLTSDGKYVLGGTTGSYSAFGEMLLAKVDSNGGSIWFQHIGQVANWAGHKVRERNDGGLLLVGYSEAFGNGGKDVYLLFTDSDGNFQEGRTYGGTEDDEGWALDLTTDGGIVVAGDNASAGPGGKAVYVIKGDTLGMTSSPQDVPDFDPLPVDEVERDEGGMLWPNVLGMGEDLHLRRTGKDPDAHARILDLQGAVVADLDLPQQEMTLHLPELAPGLYFLSVVAGGTVSRPLKFMRVR